MTTNIRDVIACAIQDARSNNKDMKDEAIAAAEAYAAGMDIGAWEDEPGIQWTEIGWAVFIICIGFSFVLKALK